MMGRSRPGEPELNGDPTMDSGSGRGAAPRVGGLVVLIFGFVFVQADLGGLPSGLQVALRIAAVVVGVGLFAAINRFRQTAAPGAGFGRRYWTIVAVEAIALVAGIIVINAVLHAHDLTVPWIAFVVGVHFFAFISLWQSRIYLVLGIVVTVLGLAGFALYAAGASAVTVHAVSGIGSGVVLYLAAVGALLRLRRAGVDRPAVDH